MTPSRQIFTWLLLVPAVRLLAQSPELRLREVREGTDPSRATIRVQAEKRAANPIPNFITGKFAEHLGWNIYNGMDAQILRNPTLADYPFWNGRMSPDGVTEFLTDGNKIDDELRRQAARFGWPNSELADLAQARADALACFWTRLGSRADVQVSPDTGPGGGRAQRVEVKAAGQGIAQWTWLPLHRQRQYQFEILARSPNLKSLTVTLTGQDSGKPICSATVSGMSAAWGKLRGSFRVPSDLPSTASYKLGLAADGPGEFVVGHVFLWPADHIQGADPDIVRFLKEAHLPILRWPGGNFVSTYHWQDGVGPVEGRPTKPNYAWGAVEPNTFGTDEFIAFCRAVGCEPMICINAGSGTPEEAARWVEYCNGSADSPMGRLRAVNGHAEPFRVRHWEVGNELWGRWQMHWTTANGYVDRYKAFAEAMRAADPGIRLCACGAPAMWGKAWNQTLIAGLGGSIASITDHPLIGGTVSPSVDPGDVYRDFMAVPEVLQQKWSELRQDLLQGGVSNPKLAVTELQLFAHLGSTSDHNAEARMTRETLPGQASITEALYDVLIYHAAVRLGSFVEMVTHSAVVNHGGGLRKEREQVWANPCHYAQAAFALFEGSTPVALEIETATVQAPMVLPDLRNAAKTTSFGAVDALGALTPGGDLLVSIVHRGASGPVRVDVQFNDFRPGAAANVLTLSAKAPWEGNSRENPTAVSPLERTVRVRDGHLELDLNPYTLARVKIPAAP